MSRFFYVFRKNGDKYNFRIYGKIYIKLKYFETEKICEEFQISCLDIKLKQFFLKFLAKKENLCVFKH